MIFMPGPEKEEDFTPAVFTDLTQILPGGGQVSQEIVDLYAELGKEPCTVERIQKIAKDHIGKLQIKKNALGVFVGAADDPEYQKISRRITAIKKKCDMLSQQVKKGRFTPIQVQQMAELRGERKASLNYATFIAMVKRKIEGAGKKKK